LTTRAPALAVASIALTALAVLATLAAASAVPAAPTPLAPDPTGLPAADAPAVDVTAAATSILRRNLVDGVVDPSTEPPTLYVADDAPLPAADRAALRRLVDQGRLRMVDTGEIRTADAPAILDETLTLPTFGTISGSYPDPNIGGVRHYIGSTADAESCTTAFPVANAYGAFTVTAGHCGEQDDLRVWDANGEPVATAVTTYDWVRSTTWASPGSIRGDVAMFLTPNPLPAIRITANHARVIRGGEDPTILEGNVCFRGATTAGERCGAVSRVNQSIIAEGRAYPVFCIYKLVGLAGDSGAPMYKKVGTSEARIRGVLSVTWDTDSDGEIDTVCGTPISRVLSITASRLLVA
jgi:hypothetical protein